MGSIQFGLLFHSIHLILYHTLLFNNFVKLISHNFSIQPVNNGCAEFDSFGDGLFVVDFDSRFYGFCSACWIKQSSIQFTIQNHLYSAIFCVQSIHTDKFNLIFHTRISCDLPSLGSQFIIKRKNIQTLIAQRIQRFPESLCRKTFEGFY